jgi:uncharacterized RDD family membrane protein YckC
MTPSEPISSMPEEKQNEEGVGAKPAAFSPNNGRRFAAFFADSVIVGMLGMVLFAAIGAPIFHYYDTAKEISGAASEVEAVARATHLLASEDTLSPSSSGETSLGRVWLLNLSRDDYVESIDSLRYYVCVYKTQDVTVYTQAFLGGKYASLFDETKNSVLTLRSEQKALISGYLSGQNITTEATASFNSGLAAFRDFYQASWLEIGKSPAYFQPYSRYASLNEKMSYDAGDAALLSYFLAALLYYVGTPFVLKNGRTVSKKIFHLNVISAKGNLTAWQIISRGIIESFENAWLTVFAPFFFIQLPALTLNFFALGLFTMNMVSLIIASALLLLLSGGLALFDKEKASLHDLSSFTRVVFEDSALPRMKEAVHGTDA